MVKECKFKIGDLVVGKYTAFDNCINICRVTDIEYIDELHEYWMDGYDEEPYYLYETEVVYSKAPSDFYFDYKIGDYMCFEDDDAISLLDFFSQKEATVEDYIDAFYNNKKFFE